MEIKVEIVRLLESREGKSQKSGESWHINTYLCETYDQFKLNKFTFDVFGEERIKRLALKEGNSYTIYFDLNGREYQGKWYTSIRVYDARLIEEGKKA